MKQYTQYIYKDGEWRVVGASNSSPFPQIHGTLADPVDLRELQTGNYLLSGRILIDDNSYMETSSSGYGTQEIPETLFGVQRDDDYDMYIYVTCDYGNFTYGKDNQDDWNLYECNYYANQNEIPTKTSDLTNDSGFITSEVNSNILNGSQTGSLRTINSTAEDTNYIIGENAFAEGYHTKASGNRSHAEGYGTIASGNQAHAEGYETTASGNHAHVEGRSTLASSPYQHVEGKYNIEDTDETYAHIVGNGSSSTRSNAYTLDWDGNGVYAGKVTVGTAPINNMDVATKKYVDDSITALPEPMIFKGSLGTGGTITTLPTASSSNEGFTYKVITAGTYASQTAKVGDTFISDGSAWVLIPSGDEPSGTVTSITLNATSPIAIDDNTAITSSGTRTLSHANSGVTAGTYKSVTVDAKGHVTGGTNPTTLSGYGITDANINNGVITLGSNTITPLTSSSTLDATKLSGTIPSGCYTDTKYTAGSNIDITSNVIKNTGVIDVAASPAAASNGTIAITKGTSEGSSTSYVTVKGLDNAAYKDVDTSISAGSSSTKLPTSAAVATFVEGKGYTTNTGTITGVSVNGTSVATSGVANITSVPASILTGAIPSAVTATTQSSGDNSTKIATTAYADGAVSNRLEKSYSGTNIVGTTLWSGNSLVSTVVNTQTTNGNSTSLSDTGVFLGDNSKGKLKISNGTNNDSIELGRTYNNDWYGLEVDSSGVSITGLKTPTNNTDAVNKQYVDNNHSIKDITNGNVYIGNLENGYYNVFAGVTLYDSEETEDLILSIGRKAFMYVSHELSDGEDTVSYWILNDETDIDVDASESTAVLNNWGQILYQGVFVDSTGDSWRSSFSLKQTDYVTAYDVADNLTTNNSYKVLSARQGYLLNQNKQNTILSGTTNPTSDLGVNGDVYIKYSAS